MRKRLLAVTLSVMMTASMLAGCGGKADTKDTKKVQEEQDASKEEGTAEDSSEKKNAAEDAGLEDGVYTIRLRYRAPSATVNTVDMYINNTKVGTPEFAQTDNDNTVWNTALMSVSLRKGANTFELKANSSGAGDLYLDNIVIERK